MATAQRESTRRLAGPRRALPIIAVAASIVAVATHRDGFVPAGAVPRAAAAFDVRKNGHAFLLRKPLPLEAGTIIRGVKPPASVVLLPASSLGTR